MAIQTTNKKDLAAFIVAAFLGFVSVVYFDFNIFDQLFDRLF